jgi:glutathione reductase (NADPH)
MSDERTVDLAVIGGGSAGVRVARVTASLGAKVALFEDAALGGTCVNLGCIPKKLLAYGAHAAHEIEEARGMGWSIGDARVNWPTLRARKDAEIARLNGAYEALLRDAGVEIVRARAGIERTAGALVVRGGHHVVRAKHVAVATGGAPKRPEIAGAELADVSDDFFHWPALPRSVAIVGAGYVATEIASVLAALGVRVELLARRSVLSSFDPDLGAFLTRELGKHDVGVRESWGEPVRVERAAEHLAVVSATGERVTAERVLFAVGRTPHVRGFGLEALGVATRDGAIVVDDRFATNVPGVHAIGDVIARRELTPIALAEGTLLARQLFGQGGHDIDYDLAPSAVFSLPPVGTVGLSEPAARARGHVLRIFKTEFQPLKTRISGSTERTMMKLVVDAATDVVLGVHMVGADAPEIIQGFAVALVAGVTKAQIDRTIGVHPTAAEELVTMRAPIGS